MGMSYEWDGPDAHVGWSYPGDEDFTDSDELTKPALVLGGAGGGGLVVEGTKEELIEFAKRVLAAAEQIDWVEINQFIDLGLRNNEDGYVDSIKLVHEVITTIVTTGTNTAALELRETLDAKLRSDIMEIEDSGYDLDTMHDLLTEWEELAEEHDLHAYADGEAGVYRVTNLPEED